MFFVDPEDVLRSFGGGGCNWNFLYCLRIFVGAPTATGGLCPQNCVHYVPMPMSNDAEYIRSIHQLNKM